MFCQLAALGWSEGPRTDLPECAARIGPPVPKARDDPFSFGPSSKRGLQGSGAGMIFPHAARQSALAFLLHQLACFRVFHKAVKAPNRDVYQARPTIQKAFADQVKLDKAHHG
jgi:hypothetical protein